MMNAFENLCIYDDLSYRPNGIWQNNNSKILSSRLKYQFFDTDEEIKKKG